MDAAGSPECLIDGGDELDDALATEEWLGVGGDQQPHDAGENVLDSLVWTDTSLS
jgi:hypothetical protein